MSQEGRLAVRHFDLYAQALAKLERGFDQDRQDVGAISSVRSYITDHPVCYHARHDQDSDLSY